MGQAGPLRWHNGRGWLILVGGGEAKDLAPIYRTAIDAMTDESPAVYVPTASATPDEGREHGTHVIVQLEALNGPASYIAPLFSRPDATDPKNVRRVKQAGLIYLGNGQPERLVEALTGTPTLDAILAAYEAGTVILAEGDAACALGAWSLCAEGTSTIGGWGWLPDGLICPHFDDSTAPTLHEAIKAHPECLGLGIPEGIGLALGPEGQVQTLSTSGKQVTVVLGPRFRAPDEELTS